MKPRCEAHSARSQQPSREKAGAEHFLGVTVQPMIRLDGYELIVGSSIDPQFGPVLLFGTGGQLVEVFRDRALALPPLNTTLARRMMEQTRVFTALEGVRGRKAVDLGALEELLVRFSQLVVEQPLHSRDRHQSRCSLRPTDCSPSMRAWCSMSRDVPDEKLPRPAIRPYPVQYVQAMDHEEWRRRDDPSDPSRGRAAADPPAPGIVGTHACTCATSSR